MKVTREKHFDYMFKLAPQLAAAYFVQAYFYLNYGPEQLAKEIVVTLGVGLILLVLGFYLHDQLHNINLHEDYLEVSFSPLKIKREVKYRDIINIEINKNKKDFSDITIEARDGRVIKLLRVDNAELIQKRIYGRA